MRLIAPINLHQRHDRNVFRRTYRPVAENPAINLPNSILLADRIATLRQNFYGSKIVSFAQRDACLFFSRPTNFKHTAPSPQHSSAVDLSCEHIIVRREMLA